jgi:hypothetical protein
MVESCPSGWEAETDDSDDSASDSEYGDEQLNNGRGRLRKTSLSHVLLLVSLCGAFASGRQAKFHRERLNWDGFLQGMSRSDFSRMFRMDHGTFQHFVHCLSPRLQRDVLQSERAGGYISPSLQLGFTLRWLSGGSYLDLMHQYGVSRSAFYKLCAECCDAIVAEFPIEFDMTPAALRYRALEFGQRQHTYMRVFKKVVGCIDGILIKVHSCICFTHTRMYAQSDIGWLFIQIKCPGADEVGQPRQYFCRKGFFSLNVQVKFFCFVSSLSSRLNVDVMYYVCGVLVCTGRV